MAPKRKTKATGSDDPEPVRVVKLKWRSPFDNALKEGKFKIKQSDDNVRMSAVAECISRVEGQKLTMMRIWLDDHEGYELKLDEPAFPKHVVKLDRDEKRKRAESLEWSLSVQINMTNFMAELKSRTGQKRVYKALGIDSDEEEGEEEGEEQDENDKKAKKKKDKEEKTTPPPKKKRQKGVRCVRHAYKLRTTGLGRSHYVRHT